MYRTRLTEFKIQNENPASLIPNQWSYTLKNYEFNEDISSNIKIVYVQHAYVFAFWQF